MGRSVLFAALLGGVLLVAATSRSDVAAPAATPIPALPSGMAAAEPISGTAAVSAPGDETPTRDPFTPYNIGPPGTKAWAYADLSPSEKAEVDRGRDTTGWDQVHSAYAMAVAERAHQATGDAAAHQLGVDNLASTGVVP
jgi:hypothetical protein